MHVIVHPCIVVVTTNEGSVEKDHILVLLRKQALKFGHMFLPGAYEPPKAAKERNSGAIQIQITCGSGRGNTCMSMAIAFPIDAQFPNMESFWPEFVF